jgi:Flp pilus assembly protein TadD
MNDAIDDFQRVVRLDPQNSHAHYNLGRALAARGSLTDALSEVQEATVLSPGDTVPRALAGELERALKGR